MVRRGKTMSERTMNWNEWTELEVFDDDYYDIYRHTFKIRIKPLYNEEELNGR